MGLFSNKCTKCGSTEHNSSNCPHGIFSGGKCSKCGSKEHRSVDCPHGVFSGKKCSNCGSKDHKTSQCPNKRFSGDVENSSSGGGQTGCVAIIIVLVLALAAFSLPFKLIDSNFSCFGFDWLNFSDVWIFSASAWITLYFIYYFIIKMVKESKENRYESLGSPYLILPLFSLSFSCFLTILFSYLLESNYWILALTANVLILGILYLIFKLSEKNVLVPLIISACCMILPYVYIAKYSNKYFVSSKNIVSPPKDIWRVNSGTGANLRAKPSANSPILIVVPNTTEVQFLNDSSSNEKLIWYKIKYENSEGWISKSLLTK